MMKSPNPYQNEYNWPNPLSSSIKTNKVLFLQLRYTQLSMFEYIINNTNPTLNHYQ